MACSIPPDRMVHFARLRRAAECSLRESSGLVFGAGSKRRFMSEAQRATYKEVP